MRRHDVKNCGQCGKVCPTGAICVGGKCDQAADFTKTAIRRRTKTSVARTQTATSWTKTPTSLPCQNGVKDGNETDIDCGGSCSPCVNGKSCLVNNDCQSHLCH